MTAAQKGVVRTALPMVGQAYTMSAPQFSGQTCINFYPSMNQAQQGGKYASLLFPTPGLTSVANLSTQASQTVRWMGSIAGTLYAVVGNGLYSVVPTTGAYTLIGNLNTSIGIVKHCYNNTQLMLVDGKNGYVYQIAASTNSQGLTPGQFAVITDSIFNSNAAPFTITFQQGYGIYAIPGTNVFQVGTIDDLTSWPVLYQASFQFTGDNIVTAISTHLDVWIFGQTRTEVRQNQPNASTPLAQPFEPISGVLVERGCAAQYSPCLLANNLLWLSANEQGGYEVLMSTGEYVPIVVSTEPLQQEWNTYATVADAQAFGYIFNGHAFYVLTFPTAGKTWVFDAYQGLWHQWSTFNNTSIPGRHLGNCFCFYNNVPYVGGYNTAKIYKLDAGSYTDDGTLILRERTFPTEINNLIRTSITQVWIDCEVGVGLNSGQGQNPRIMLQTSGDGGKTWNPERLGNLGMIGQYNTKVRWYRFGTKRQFTCRVRISDPVYIALFGAFIEILSGDA